MKRTLNIRLLTAAIVGGLAVIGAFGARAQDALIPPPDSNFIRPMNPSGGFVYPKMENVEGDPITNEAELKALLSKQQFTEPPAQGVERERTRGGYARKQCGSAGYKGVCDQLWEFENSDFPSTGNTCGQAAAATIITHWQKTAQDAAFRRKLVSFLYNSYGPNNAFGLLGTSWQQVVNSIIVPYKMSWRKVSGESDLRTELNKGIPVIVMLDAERLRQKGYGYNRSPVGISGHWVVVYGYDSGYYYVTNHNGNWIARADFLESWDTWIHGGFDGGKRGYVFWK